MDRSSNDGIYILFTESHEILPNPYNICNVSNTYEWRNKENFFTQIEICNRWNGIDKFYLDLCNFV